MATGKVKFSNAEKGFSFTVPDNGDPDVFVHVTAVQDAGMDILLADQRVSFDMGQDTMRNMPWQVSNCQNPRIALSIG